MSVINQMLRDIDKRKSNVVQGSPSQTSGQSNNILLIIVVTLLNILLVLVGYWLWQNVPVDKLESHNTASEEVLKISSAISNDISDVTLSNEGGTPKPISAIPEKVETQSQQAFDQKTKPQQVEKEVNEPLNIDENLPAKTATELLNTQQPKEQVKSVQEPQKEKAKAKPSLNIEKIELSKEELIEHKRTLLAQAKANQELDKAIQYARELHQLNPQAPDDIAELAALLYAKGDFDLVEALLLSGLRYESGELKLRLMLARLYYKNGRLNSAHQVLMEKQPDVSANLDYYVLRASLARELEKFELGMQDYALLTQVNPNQGSWWLGYALCADSAAKRSQAVNGYQRALATATLGSSSVKFAQQRLQVLEN